MLLLDTSVLVWLLIDSPKLGPRARSRIDRATTVHFSAVSVAELTIKSMLGRITVPDDLPAAIRAQGLSELALTADHARAIGEFATLVRHDPFDRLLLAQAREHGLTLLTADRVMLGLELAFVVSASD